VAYDLLIMDIQMPEMNGIQAVRCIRRLLGSTIRVIFATGSPPYIYRDICLNAGGNEFIRKPFAIDDLDAAIDRAMS